MCESANFFIDTPALSMKDCLMMCIKEYKQWSIRAPGPVKTFVLERVEAAKEMMGHMDSFFHTDDEDYYTKY